ncbi:hypothetical protein Spb1_29970 [Planctopirus ephydatiae]|uniref:Beta-galactosidase n=1 Tax=Planctopirus ephydatiae TaxID=2528019 RepID=A0A518GR45_9PLAN|nr:hypothetical protein [Planctopirus ephydatiae]QDV31060.1 hypothetical protein Spb1_29970 [Planctopirus ephydatiae]
MSSHRIALKGPWDYLWTSLTKNQQFQGSAKMPVEYTCLHGNEAGEVQYSRSFHYPRIQSQPSIQQDSPNAPAASLVFVEFSGMRGTGSVEFNSELVGTFDETSEQHSFLLPQPQNIFSKLRVFISVNEELLTQKLPAGLFSSVYLRIEE